MTVSAVLHRPRRAARSWCFGPRGVCPEAFDETDGCVPYQLAAMLQRTSPGLRASDLDSHFDEIYQQLYGHDDLQENTYLLELEDGTVERRGWKDAGVTAAMVPRFAEL